MSESQYPEREKLMPCPFCGGEATAEYKALAYDVECGTCDAGMFGFFTEAEAAVAWNRRADSSGNAVTLTPERVAALQRLVDWLESVSTWNETLAIVKGMLEEAKREIT